MFEDVIEYMNRRGRCGSSLELCLLFFNTSVWSNTPQTQTDYHSNSASVCVSHSTHTSHDMAHTHLNYEHILWGEKEDTNNM